MLPVKFIDRLKKIYPLNYENVLEGYENSRIGSFRINQIKFPNRTTLPEKIEKDFAEKNISVKPFEKISGVFLFDKKDEYALKGTDAFYNGEIYLQSIASLIPALVLEPQKGEKILDVCAAPGSKTTQLAALTQNQSEIIALEKNKIRHDKLEYNCKLQGANSVSVKKTDALKYLHDANTPKFHKILLDAPCSSEGRFDISREKSYSFWSLDKVEKNSDLQLSLLSRSLKKLKRGGVLVYSTCTLSPEENEKIVTKALKANLKCSLEPIDLFEADYFTEGIQSFQDEVFWDEISKTKRILPSKYTEGFFIAKIKRN